MGEPEYHSPIELSHLLCMKRIIITLFIAIGMTYSISAQNIKPPDSYNYNRGVEAIQNNNAEIEIDNANRVLKVTYKKKVEDNNEAKD